MNVATGSKAGDELYCSDCGASLTRSVRYCPSCGLSVAQSPLGGVRSAVLGILGFAAFTVIVVGGWSMVLPEGYAERNGAAAVTGLGQPDGTLALESVDPRQAADELFNQVVDAAAVGDSMLMQAFLPLAVMAYQEVAPLDSDGLFHLSTLQRIGEEADASLDSALSILERDPSHLLGLAAAAEAALELGWDDDATQYYTQFVGVFDVQVDRPLNEYLGHSSLLQRMKGDADAFLASR